MNMKLQLHILTLHAKDAPARLADAVKLAAAKAVVVLGGPVIKVVPYQVYDWADQQLENAAERAEIDAAIAHLLTMRNAGTTDQIKAAIEAADAASGEFAARRMDASIRKVLTGQNVNKV